MQDFFEKIKEIKLESALYIVATPIGNLADISLRALQTLSQADYIICEDTRVSGKLLGNYNIKNKKYLSYNDHSTENVRNKIYGLLQDGNSLALVCDAGTPLISDPGYKLISFLREREQKIIPIPGSSALLCAISASGLASDNFLFLGFLPSSRSQREKALKIVPKNFTFVYFESANRVVESLKSIKRVIGSRKICVAKEITKLYEELVSGDLEVIMKYFDEKPSKIRGEFVIIVEKSNKSDKGLNQNELLKEIRRAIDSGYSIKDLSQNLSEIYDLHKKEIYKLALNINKK